MELQTMYPAKLGSPQTLLAADLAADATSMVLNDVSILPIAPNIAVIGSDENCEIVSYSAIDSTTNTVSGLVRGLGGSTARIWSTGSVVARNATSLDHNRFKENIEALNSGKANTADLGDLAALDQADLTADVTGVLPVANGGTGQSSVDSTPTSGSAKMVTSGGVYTALAAKTPLATGVLRFTNQSTSVSSSSSTAFCTISNAAITTKHVVVDVTFSIPSAVTSNVTWSTDTAGKVTLSGINTDSNNKVAITLAIAGNL